MTQTRYRAAKKDVYTCRILTKNCYKPQTDICVGARVALRNWNILPCAGLYNGSIGTVIEIVYKNNLIRPNDKEHNHLLDSVVVDFCHLTLPSYIEPWDKLHPTVITITNDFLMFLFLQYQILTIISLAHC